MALNKIIESDYAEKGVRLLDTKPEMAADELKRVFDEIDLDVIIPKFNALIDAVSAITGASEIGANVPDGITADGNIMSILNAIAALSLAGKSASDILKDIVSVSDVVHNLSTELVTGKAISDYAIELGAGDMMKSVYDADNDGVVDDSEKLGGTVAGEYQKKIDDTLSGENKNLVSFINEIAAKLGIADISIIGDGTVTGGISALNNDLGSCSFSVQEDGAYVTYTPPGGADAVTKKLGSNDLQISAYLQAYANGSSHNNDSGINISVTDYSKITLNSVTPMASGYPKSYSIKINNTVVSAGAEIDLTGVDDLAIVLSIGSLEAQYKSYGFKITFTLSV
ncbi:MAG: hypothetical protein UFG06_14045 [Lachnospiraceae bacterium]|nr:hypothetical protein [Lachnospiraceae bacterium]